MKRIVFLSGFALLLCVSYTRADDELRQLTAQLAQKAKPPEPPKAACKCGLACDCVNRECGDSACSTVREAPAMTGLHWVQGPSDWQVQLVNGAGVQVGTYRRDTEKYHPFDGSAWGAATTPPIAPPVARAVPAYFVPTFAFGGSGCST